MLVGSRKRLDFYPVTHPYTVLLVLSVDDIPVEALLLVLSFF
jgi:hypothetical protein